MSGDQAREAGDERMDRVLGVRAVPRQGDVAGPTESGAGDQAQAGYSLRKSSKGGAKRGMPDPDGETDRGRRGDETDDLDELGNPRRGQTPGPDDVSDEPDRGGGNSTLFSFAAAGLVVAAAAFSPIGIAGALAAMAVIIPSLILHEMAHAKAADILGDPIPRLEGRLGWGLRDLATHIHPVWTILVPVATLLSGFFLAGARPVEPEPANFKNPVRDMAIVAAVGPATHVGLAALGAGAFAVLAAFGIGIATAGLGGVVAGALAVATYYNLILAAVNLIPFFPFDGHHILRPFLPESTSVALDEVNSRPGIFKFIPGILALAGLVIPIALGAQWLAGVLLGGVAVAGVKLAAAALPAVAAVGMLMGRMHPGAPSSPAAPSEGQRPADLVVIFSGPPAITSDSFLSSVDISRRDGVRRYSVLQQAMVQELESAGLDAATLQSYNATPTATFRRINAAALRVDAARAAEFMEVLKLRGHRVYLDERRRIPEPIPTSPEDAANDPKGAVTLDETVKLVGADKVLKSGEERWGPPDLGLVGRLAMRLVMAAVPQPKIGVIDSGRDKNHPMMKNVRSVNVTTGKDEDDIGHGTWVTSAVLNLARWAMKLTHYKTFVGGGANLTDILKALTDSANDGNIVISNSWGSDDGDPDSPDSQLVRKLAEEGHVMVFAAGNAGPGPNTIGSPAIVYYKDPKTGAIRNLSVAATGRNRKVVYFSSRGPGSEKTKTKPDYPRRPDLASVGHNKEGAWPEALGDADRKDPVWGPLKAISGTSMSAPDVAGAIGLLAMLFGVTEKGEKLDAIVNAVMSNLRKTGGEAVELAGDGFLDVGAAYEALKAAMAPVAPPFLARLVLRLFSRHRV